MQKFTVNNIFAPMRLDRYLRTIDPSLAQGIIEKALRNGDIKLASHAKLKASHRVQDGDIIFVSDRLSIATKIVNQSFSESTIVLADKILGEYLLYEHPEFFVINKPASLATQGGSKIALSIDHALKYLNTLNNDLRLVHRLDKETSGLLLIAKNRLAATKLAKGFKDRIIKKKYLALVSGKVDKQNGRIESSLLKIHDKMVQHDSGKLAITDYKIMRIFAEKGIDIAMIEFLPQTGRMHQLRYHAAEIGAPIIGDKKYGSKIYSANLMLHAASITIPKAIFDNEIIISAPLPMHFHDLIKK